jgi:membrane protein
VAESKGTIALFKETFAGFNNDEATWKAAALSYYTVFALPPLLVLLLEVASAVWDPSQVRHMLTGQFETMMGADVAGQIQTMITSAQSKVGGSGIRLVLSIGGLVFGATGAFMSLQSALNSAWEVAPDPKSGGVKAFVTKRVLSLGMVLLIAFLLLVSLVLTSALSAASGVLFGGFAATMANVLNFVLSFAAITLLFAAMYKVLPDAKVEWRDVWVGAIATGVLFEVGKYAIGLYIGKSNPGSAFGAAGSLAVLLVWIYYASVIVLLGAEFTQAWAKQHGRTIEPEEGAVRVIEKKVPVSESSPEANEPKSERSLEHNEEKKEQGNSVAVAGAQNGNGSHRAAPGGRVRRLLQRVDPFHLAERTHNAAVFLRDWVDGIIVRLRADIEAARRETSAIVRGVGTGSALFAAGAVLALLGVLSIFSGVILLVGDQWLARDRYWLAALVVTVIVGVVAVWLVRRGLAALSPRELAPHETIETLKEDAAWIKHPVAAAADVDSDSSRRLEHHVSGSTNSTNWNESNRGH